MNTLLIVLTVIEVALVVAVLAGYLVAIAATLRKISSTLGLVTFGVRAIETQTRGAGPALRDINGALEQVAAALGGAPAAGAPAGGAPVATAQESSGGGEGRVP